jgi:lipoprotein-releasing system permease protein
MAPWSRRLIKSLPFAIGLRYFLSGGRSRLVSFISMLALLGMALGVGLLILVLSVMNGFDREMRERILSVVPHIQIVSSIRSSDWQPEIEKIAQHPQVREVTPFTRVKGIVFAQENTRPIEILGLSQAVLP